MELTLAKLEKRVLLKLGWGSVPAEVPMQDVANEAGEWITSLRAWNFLRRPPLGFDTVALQEYVDLPVNWSAIISGQQGSFTGVGIEIVDIEVLSRMRGGVLTPQGSSSLWGALVMADVPAAGPVPRYRLELYPTPASPQTKAFYLVYRAGWRELTTPADHVALPQWLLRAYFEAVVAHLRAYTKHDIVLADALAPTTRYIESLYGRDANDQDDLGPIEGTAEDELNRDPLWNLPMKFNAPTLLS